MDPLAVELIAAGLSGMLAMGLSLGIAARLRHHPIRLALPPTDIRHEHSTIAMIHEEGTLRIYECKCHGARMWRRIRPDGGEERC